jgi:hypothetical protein
MVSTLSLTAAISGVMIVVVPITRVAVEMIFRAFGM